MRVVQVVASHTLEVTYLLRGSLHWLTGPIVDYDLRFVRVRMCRALCVSAVASTQGRCDSSGMAGQQPSFAALWPIAGEHTCAAVASPATVRTSRVRTPGKRL